MDKKASTKGSFAATHGTIEQYSVPTSCIGQTEGKSLSILKVSKANGGLENTKGDSTKLRQYSN